VIREIVSVVRALKPAMGSPIQPLRRVPRATGAISLPLSIDRGLLAAEFDRALGEIEARWPDAPILDDGFADYVRAHLDGQRDLAERMPRLHLDELFLVWWAMRSPSGVAAFLEIYGHDLAKAIACVSSRFPHIDASTLLQRLMAELFDGEDPRATEFSGFGSLGAWVDVVATQTLLDVAHST